MSRIGYFLGSFPKKRGTSGGLGPAFGGHKPYYQGVTQKGNPDRRPPGLPAGPTQGFPRLRFRIAVWLGAWVVMLGGLCAGPPPGSAEPLWLAGSRPQQSARSLPLVLSYQGKADGLTAPAGQWPVQADLPRQKQVERPGRLIGSAEADSPVSGLPGRSSSWADSSWPMEWIELSDGQRLFGLIESVDEQWVYFVQIKRAPGRPARLVVRPIERSGVLQMQRLPEPERQQLQERVAALAFHARIESARMEAIVLEKRIQNNISVFLYLSRWFRLESTLSEPMTRRAIVRLEQIFSGYRQLLPPRTEPQKQLTILIFASRMEYQEALGRYGIQLANPAVFLPKQNLVIAGTDLGQFAAQLKQLEEEHSRLRQELSRLRSQLAKKLEELGRKLRQQGAPRQEAAKILQRERATFDNQIAQKLAEIQRVDRKNSELFAALMEQTLRQLYHEAFHAYMENYLFPSSQYQVPLWLQEGLATLFQEGIVEAESLRIDSPSPAAVARIRQDQRQGTFLSLRELLAAGRTDFLQPPGSGSGGINRYYAYAWAVVYYLCQTERLSPAALEAYVRPEAQALSPLQRLERLVGMDVAQWQEGWQKFLRSL